MKIDIYVPPITHGAPDADQYTPLIELAMEFSRSLLVLLESIYHEPFDGNNVRAIQLQQSDDELMLVLYHETIVGITYLNRTDFNYIDAYFLYSRTILREIGLSMPLPCYGSDEEFVEMLNNILQHQTNNLRVDVDIYTRKCKESDDYIVKLTFMDKLVGLIYHGENDYYFICKEGIDKARKRYHDAGKRKIRP